LHSATAFDMYVKLNEASRKVHLQSNGLSVSSASSLC